MFTNHREQHGRAGRNSPKPPCSRQYSDKAGNTQVIVNIQNLILSFNATQVWFNSMFWFTQATAQLREAFKNPAIVPALVTVLGSSQNPQVGYDGVNGVNFASFIECFITQSIKSLVSSFRKCARVSEVLIAVYCTSLNLGLKAFKAEYRLNFKVTKGQALE